MHYVDVCGCVYRILTNSNSCLHVLIYVRMWVKVKGCQVSSSIALHLRYQDKVSDLNPELTDLASLTNQFAHGTLPLPLWYWDYRQAAIPNFHFT